MVVCYLILYTVSDWPKNLPKDPLVDLGYIYMGPYNAFDTRKIFFKSIFYCFSNKRVMNKCIQNVD